MIAIMKPSIAMQKLKIKMVVTAMINLMKAKKSNARDFTNKITVTLMAERIS